MDHRRRSGSSSLRPAALLGAIVVAASAAPALAAAPLLYDEPFHQSPVRGEPDDLLMLPGSGFAPGDVVVYQRLVNTTLPLVHPSSVPPMSTPNEGVADVVTYGNVPNSLTVKLPSVILSGRSYAFWILNIGGEWSEGVRINDARPLWITPDVAYRTASLAGLPRELKVVGRNLQPQPGSVTKVRLTGPATYVRNAFDDGDPNTAVERYVARVKLPTNMRPGIYAVEVQRDGVSWVALQGQSLTVLKNPAPSPAFHVSNYGCSSNDGLDDTACVVNAVNDAALAGGGTVVFGGGRWDLIDPTVPGVDPVHGIILPPGVGLRGAGAGATTVAKSAGWNVVAGAVVYFPVFTVQGRNTIQRIRFQDERSYAATDWTGPIFQLGKLAYHPNPGPSPVEEVVITRNVFARPFVAVGDGGLPIRHLYVTYNEFGAFRDAVAPSGNRYLTNVKFRVDDSIIAHNTFKPGAYIDACAHQGTIASEIGASTRLDFSGNVADGFAPDYLDGSPPGWRATYFFHMNNNHEMSLVSQNSATCTGDKTGDGEAIAYDNNANTIGFKVVKDVAAATSTTVTVSTADGFPLETIQNLNPVPVDYYNEHWVQVVNGRGLGQVRKIQSYVVDPIGQTVTFTVAPPWDVIPQFGSPKITVAREFWQVATVDNTVDNRGCTKNNQNGIRHVGLIGYAGMAADVAGEGNVQYESGGIAVLAAHNSVEDPSIFLVPFNYFQYFVDVRGNTIADEFDYDSGCGYGGISLWHGAHTAAVEPQPASPAVLGYGVSIARNVVSHADGIRGGAVVLADTWHEPAGSRMYVNTLIHHNRISDLMPPPSTGLTSLDQCTGTAYGCDNPVRGVGVHIRLPLSHLTLLYQNLFGNVPTPLIDNGTGTVQVP